MDKILKIFKKHNNIIIGVIHFPPLVGYPDFPGLKIALATAKKDLQAFTQGGVDGIIIENNYDVPHTEFVTPQIASAMMDIGLQLQKNNKLPLGVSVLWNDFKNALSIAKKIKASYIRIPVFVDRVKTNYGIIQGNSAKVLKFRRKIKAENVAIFTDIHVKHSVLLSKNSLVQSAKLAIKNGSDAIVLTGNWTGQEPNLNHLKKVRQIVGDFPIFVGSGASVLNIKRLLKYANGVIVSTSLKRGKADHKVNIKNYTHRIEMKKVQKLVNASR
ncbi:MAG: BtpA/SgcQ family protein [bacterium]|nr:BtpA/SgcQ family protein [bacterium]